MQTTENKIKVTCPRIFKLIIFEKWICFKLYDYNDKRIMVTVN